jgi:hypothetical protein
MTLTESWTEPDQVCTPENRYTHLLLTKDGTKEERERMARACRACSVQLDCIEDVIASGQAWEYHEVQAGFAES